MEGRSVYPHKRESGILATANHWNDACDAWQPPEGRVRNSFYLFSSATSCSRTTIRWQCDRVANCLPAVYCDEISNGKTCMQLAPKVADFRPAFLCGAPDEIPFPVMVAIKVVFWGKDMNPILEQLWEYINGGPCDRADPAA